MVLEKIKIKDLIRSGERELAIQEFYSYEDLPLKDPVQVVTRIRLNSVGLTVSGSFRALLEEPCDRCYEPFERIVSDSFEERFVYEPLTDKTPPGEMELRSENFYEPVDPEGELDLKDLVHQLVVIAISHDRVCRRDSCSLTV